MQINVGYSWVRIKLLFLLLLLQAFIIIRQRQTLHTWMIFNFLYSRIFEKVVKWGSGSFEFYLLVRVISS